MLLVAFGSKFPTQLTANPETLTLNLEHPILTFVANIARKISCSIEILVLLIETSRRHRPDLKQMRMNR